MGVYIQVNFTDYEGVSYQIDIEDDTYTGEILNIPGKATLDRPKVKTMDMLRGSTLKINLEASVDDDYILRILNTVGDKKLPVTLYRNDSIFWKGFIKQDGIIESFVADYWIINIQAIDGLGYLENTKFLDSNGLAYQDNLSELNILSRCLELTGQEFDFRIYDFNLFYTIDDSDPTTSNKALTTTFVNTDRYQKEDQENSVFTAKEVLESLLKKYGAYVTQENGVWHIVRIIDFFNNDNNKEYSQYDFNGSLLESLSENVSISLGSQIDDYYPHHAGGNQQKNYNASLGAYKVLYNYGFVVSILENRRIYWNDNIGDIDGWIYEDLAFFGFELQEPIPSFPSGYYTSSFLSADISSNVGVLALKSDSSLTGTVDEGASILVQVKLTATQFNYFLKQSMLVILIGDSGTNYYLNNNGEWTLSGASIRILTNYIDVNQPQTYSANTTVQSNSLPENGTIEVRFNRPLYDGVSFEGQDSVVINEVNVTGSTELNVKGESHTAIRTENATAIVETDDNIYVGDNDSDIYIGGIETDADENTKLWSKVIDGSIDNTKKFKLLEWLVRDRLKISSGNATIFSGKIYGYLPYLGVLTINNIEGFFMPISWSYDLKENIISAEHERIFSDDIYNDIRYSFALESENVVRPAIE